MAEKEIVGLMGALGYKSTAEFAPDWRVLSDTEKTQLREYYRLGIASGAITQPS